MADYTFVNLFPALAEREQTGWNEELFFGNPMLNPDGVVTITHLIMTGVLVAIIAVLALIARRKYRTHESALIPDGKLTVANFFETIFEAVLNMMGGMMGEENAKRYFPLIASLGIFIFLGNLMGLVAGLAPPTSSLNTSLACGLVVFIVYNVGGLWSGGWDYVKHFFGPVIFIAPLMLIIELVSHGFRPLSLAIRLGGNMTGDHMVIGVFGELATMVFGVPFLIPVPFLFLGLLVSTIQALVFSMLSTIYISLAIHHEEEG